MANYAPTTIDLSRLPPPAAIDEPDFETLFAAFGERFLDYWNAARARDPDLPEYDVHHLETGAPAITGQAWSWLRLLDRARVNDAFRALLAAYATGSDLDAVAASRNIERLIVVPATATAAAVAETDEALLRRYLLSFDRASAGSPAGILYEAWTAWPAMHDARVNGYAVHGRRGDRDLVIIGPGGRVATAEEKARVRDAVTADHVTPEGYGLSVLDARQAEYEFSGVIEVPPGPDATLVVAEAVERVRAAGTARLLIGGEVPGGLLSGAAYGASIIRVRDLAPVAIAADPYTIPVLRQVTITAEVRR